MGGVEPIRHLTPEDADYPEQLRGIVRPPLHVSVRGSVRLDGARAVAIVGTREAHKEAAEFATHLAFVLARSGVVIVSGGAVGIDAAAHEGAMKAGGRTWAVAGTGSDHVFPKQHARLYDDIAESGGAMVWPFAPAQKARNAFLARNGVLVALSDVVVVAQAGIPSGALNAAKWAGVYKKPLWVVPSPPWTDGFAGSAHLINRGASVLTSVARFLEVALERETPGAQAVELPRQTTLRLDLGEDAIALQKATSSAPKHQDELAAFAGLSAKAAATALLTLALENVVVEGPGGFFRRAGP